MDNVLLGRVDLPDVCDAQMLGRVISGSAPRAAIKKLEHSGIYFLLQKERVIYVGQSVDVPQRLLTHLNEGRKNFDSYSWVPCDRTSLNDYEAFWIVELRPELNHSLPHNNLYKPFKAVRKTVWHRFNGFVIKRPMLQDWGVEPSIKFTSSAQYPSPKDYYSVSEVFSATAHHLSKEVVA
jgi:hypothetical protein